MILKDVATFQSTTALSKGMGVKFLADSGVLKVRFCNSQGERVDGVALHEVEADEFVSVAFSKEVEGLASGAISVGANVTPTAAGKFETASSGDHVFGIAKTAGATDRLFEIVRVNGTREIAGIE